MSLSDLILGARPSGRTALSARWIVAHAEGQHRLLENGEIVIDGSEVLYVGHRFPGEVARRIDLGQVTQVSSLTVGLMVACYRRAAKQGKAIQFENVSESLHKIIRVSGLQAVLLGGE